MQQQGGCWHALPHPYQLQGRQPKEFSLRSYQVTHTPCLPSLPVSLSTSISHLSTCHRRPSAAAGIINNTTVIHMMVRELMALKQEVGTSVLASPIRESKPTPAVNMNVGGILARAVHRGASLQCDTVTDTQEEIQRTEK